MSNTLTNTVDVTAEVDVVTFVSYLTARVDFLAQAAAIAELAFLDEEFNDDDSVESLDTATLLGWELLKINGALNTARELLSFES